MSKSLPALGYHIKAIPKGVLGEASKIVEEAQELQDAVDQNVQIMALVELSDLVGAISAYLAKHHPSTTWSDLFAMSQVTARAFSSGRRQCSTADTIGQANQDKSAGKNKSENKTKKPKHKKGKS